MKKKNLLAIGLAFVLSLTLILSGCGNGSSSKDSSSSSASDSSSSSEALSGKITIGGSTALQPLAAQAAKEFMEKNPDVQIEVQGGGSGTGLSEVQAGNFDIGMSDVFAESKKGKGIDASALKDYQVAVVGMTAAVNAKAGVKNLTKQQLQDVFTGKVKNWKEVGGKDQKITLVNRPDGSGTRATFDQFALDGKTPAEGITQDSTNTVKKIITETPGAVGYMALSYFSDSDKDVVKLSIDGVEATDDNVASGKFPVWAYEHMYTKGEPSKLVKAFLDFVMGDDVQTKDVPAQGYLSVKDMKVQRDADGKQTDK